MKKQAELFTAAVSKYKAIAIYIPGSPDPDAIASAFALKLILGQFSIDSEIFAEKRLSLSQNRVFVERLKIPVSFCKEINLQKFQAYIVADFQDNRVEHIGEKIPCAAHIDHHSILKNRLKADYSLIRTDAGSTSTLVALILKNLELSFTEQEMEIMSTALTFGVQADTDNYVNITSLDIQALVFLSEFSDSSILQGISSTPLSAETLLNYNRAREAEVVYRDWAFYGIGFIGSKNRDSIAIAADMLLEKSGHKTVAVFAVIDNHKNAEMYLDVSLRSNSSAVDLNRIIKRITPNGGGRKFKGAFQVNLNYFLSAPDREMLWSVIEATTIETLRKSRDTFYISGFESAYHSFKNKVMSLLNKSDNKS